MNVCSLKAVKSNYQVHMKCSWGSINIWYYLKYRTWYYSKRQLKLMASQSNIKKSGNQVMNFNQTELQKSSRIASYWWFSNYSYRPWDYPENFGIYSQLMRKSKTCFFTFFGVNVFRIKIRPEMDQRGTPWKWILTILKCKNEFPK